MKLIRISWLPAVIMMIIIFYFSSKPAVRSGESSMLIANKILDVYENITNTQIQDEDKIEILGNIDHVIRKGAHFIEYGILACTIAFHFLLRKKKNFRFFIYTVILSAIYAATDEFHQLFIPGRSGAIKDVLLDSAGAATGAIFFCLIIKLTRKKRSQDTVI